MEKEDIIFEDNIIKTPPIKYNWPFKSVGALLFQKISQHNDKIAFIDRNTEISETYSSFFKRCIRTALVMQQKGIKSGDVIALCSVNHRDTFVPFIAAQFLGVITCALHPSLTIRDSTHLIKLVEPKLIFSDDISVDLIEKCLETLNIQSKIVVFGSTKTHIEFSKFLEIQDDEDSFKPVEVQDIKETALIIFSSGTTGMPKGICISQYSLLCQMFRNAEMVRKNLHFFKANEPNIFALFSSLYWFSGIAIVLFSVFFGTTVLIYNNFNIETYWDDLKRFKINSAFYSPIQVVQICKSKKPDNVDTSSLNKVVVAGSPISKYNILKCRELLPEGNVCQMYAQSESGGVVTQFETFNERHRSLLRKNPDSSGLPFEGIWYKVVDVDTEEPLGPNQKGELRIKSTYVMNGYYKMDSSSTFDKDGFLKTGDIAYYDEDFCFYIVDRIKELLKYRNWQVPPALLENILFQHPAVKEVVVIGKPHEEDGDHPLAVVVLQKNSLHITSKEIEQYIEERVHDTQRLRGGVIFVESFPMTPSGKIKRKELKEFVLKQIVKK